MITTLKRFTAVSLTAIVISSVLINCTAVPYCINRSESNRVSSHDSPLIVRQPDEICVHSLSAGMAVVHIIETATSLYVIDAGWPGNQQHLYKKIRELKKPVRFIFITHGHFDHYGSAAALRRLTGAPILIHEADAGAMAHAKSFLGHIRSLGYFAAMMLPVGELILRPEHTRADIVLKGGERLDKFGLDAVVIHIPGHTPGSCCLLINDSIAFVGDMISRGPSPYSQRYFASNWNMVAQSLETLKRISPLLSFYGHGKEPITRTQLFKLRPYLPKE